MGGAGSQASLALTLLRSFHRDIAAGRLRFALVAATHRKLAEQFGAAVKALGLEGQLGTSGSGIEILFEPEIDAYFRRFNKLLLDTDVLFTKPSEMTFFAALGLPIVFSWPVGVHERYNRRWAIEGERGSSSGIPTTPASGSPSG